MAVLRLNVPLATEEPILQVENQLRVGRHVFRLVVEGHRGDRSEPRDVVIQVIPA
jgi:hypothetical protein